MKLFTSAIRIKRFHLIPLAKLQNASGFSLLPVLIRLQLRVRWLKDPIQSKNKPIFRYLGTGSLNKRQEY